MSLSLIVTAPSIGQTASFGQTASGTSIQSLTFGNLIDPGINPLRPVGDYTEIQELINTASYINTQVSNAQASVVEMAMMTPENASDANSAIVPVAGRTDSHKIDLMMNTPKKNIYKVEILTKDKTLFFYEWHVKKGDEKDCKDCWFTSAVSIPVDQGNSI